MMAIDDDPIDAGTSQDKFLLHPSDPINFLKLCAAIHTLLCHQLTDTDIDHADTFDSRVLYGTDLYMSPLHSY